MDNNGHDHTDASTRKLRVPLFLKGIAGTKPEYIAFWSACDVYRTFLPPLYDQDFMTCAAYVIVKSSAIGYIDENVPDGEWIPLLNLPPNYVEANKETEKLVRKNLNKQRLHDALVLVIATKVNWWRTTEHVGDGCISPYIRDVLNGTVWNKSMCNKDVALRSLETAGKWASTCIVLKALGLQGIRETKNIPVLGRTSLNLDDNFHSPVESFPAGSERLNVSFQIIQVLSVNELVHRFPGAEDLLRLAELRSKVAKNRVYYHTMAPYLTGKPDAGLHPEDMVHVLGRLGSFIRWMCPDHPLNATHHMCEKKESSIEWIYQNYPDYNEAWEQVCERTARLADMKGIDRAVEMVRQATRTFSLRRKDRPLKRWASERRPR
ncbi:hypothetical protein M514_01311 [Trichuris suis]|uniref:Uncharacterized protein n=1 Tax=Trichuris suis TaxID=68888 RepID=A0A085MK95_9BILA|nr:hypothetical protein M513_01311 [Trichuris suis]KFD72275.1 hypothetical protein M514_01311 [Trichuris suis]